MKIRAAIGLTALLGCNEPPSAPTVAIDPLEPTTLDPLQAVLLSEARDPDEGDALSYTYQWSVDGTAVGSGTTIEASETAKGQTWTLTVTASDGVLDGPASSAMATILNTPPVAEAAFDDDEPYTTDDLVVVVETSDVDGDDVALDYAWTVDGESTEHDSDTIPAEDTERDQVWEVTVTPSDGEEDGEPVTASVRVGNHAPELSSVVVSPGEAYESTTLTASVASSDDDGDEITLRYSWRVGGTQVSTEATLDGALFDKHDEVVLVVTPSDGFAEGDAVSSDTVTILNTPPAVASVALDPTGITESSIVTCLAVAEVDDDGDEVALSIAWSIDGAVVATGGTLTGDLFNKGDLVSCTATPNDGEEDGEPVDAVALTVMNTPPVLGGATLSTTSPDESDTLRVTLSGARDDDGDPISFSYRWYLNGVSGPTSSSVDGIAFDKGDEVYVVVTPADSEDDGSPVSSDVATVVNTPPEVTSVTLSPSEVYTNDRLSATVLTTDADGDVVHVSYAWYVDGSLATSGSSTLAGETWFDKGDAVQVTVSVNDDDGSGDSRTSDSVTVLNSPPSAPVVSIDPSSPVDGDDLVCVVDVDASDNDGDDVSYDFAWELDGADYLGPTATTTHSRDTIDAVDTADGDAWTCIATPDDGDDVGPAAEDSVTVGPLNDTEDATEDRDWCSSGSAYDVFEASSHSLSDTTSFPRFTATFEKCSGEAVGSTKTCHIELGTYTGPYDPAVGRYSWTWAAGEYSHTVSWDVWTTESAFMSAAHGTSLDFYIVCRDSDSSTMTWRAQNPVRARKVVY